MYNIKLKIFYHTFNEHQYIFTSYFQIYTSYSILLSYYRSSKAEPNVPFYTLKTIEINGVGAHCSYRCPDSRDVFASTGHGHLLSVWELSNVFEPLCSFPMKNNRSEGARVRWAPGRWVMFLPFGTGFQLLY